MYIERMVTDLTTTPNGYYGELDGKKFGEFSPLEKSYRKNDIKIFTDSKIINHYKSKNKPSINKFEIILTEFDDNLRCPPDIEELTINKFGEKDSEVTRIIFNKNWARDFYPFTRWILAHRIFHAIQIPIYGLNIQKVDDFIKHIELLKFGNNISILDNGCNLSIQPYYKEEDNIKIRFIRSLFKFRSARCSNRLINLDLYAELFAQYQITGKVSFNRTDNDDINSVLDSFEPTINSIFDDICRRVDKGTFAF